MTTISPLLSNPSIRASRVETIELNLKIREKRVIDYMLNIFLLVRVNTLNVNAFSERIPLLSTD